MKEGWLREEALISCSGPLLCLGLRSLSCLEEGELSMPCKLVKLLLEVCCLGLLSLGCGKGELLTSISWEVLSLGCEDLALLRAQKTLLTSRAVEKSLKRDWLDEEDVFLLPLGFSSVDVALSCRFLALLMQLLMFRFIGNILLPPFEEFPFANTG